MLMYAIANRVCTNTVRESALNINFWRQIPCRTGDSNPRHYCAWIFSLTFYPLSYPARLMNKTVQCSLQTNAPHVAQFSSKLALERRYTNTKKIWTAFGNPPGMRVSIRYINSTNCTFSAYQFGCVSCVYTPVSPSVREMEDIYIHTTGEGGGASMGWVGMYVWWSLFTLYLLACQVRVTISDWGLCYCVCVTSCELINSIVRSFCTGSLSLVLFQIVTIHAEASI